MAIIFAHSSNTWILSAQVLLLSTAVFSMGMILKLSVPLVLDFLVNELPLIWSSFHLWLTPPYLYFVINGIIITIAASSKFQHENEEEMPGSAPVKSPEEITTDFAVAMKIPGEIRPEFEVLEPARYGEAEMRFSEVKANEVEQTKEEEEDFVISKSEWSLSRSDSIEIPLEIPSPAKEKPLVTSRFGHRKTVKASPEGSKALGVAKPKRRDTLESTWKTMTDGRAMPLTRHLKKSDSWENNRPQSDCLDPSSPVMKKSETFRDSRSSPAPSPSPSPSSGKLRKEPSLSQDELNRRVEAFIKKFNDEMRLQRQESFQHYVEMVNRGAH